MENTLSTRDVLQFTVHQLHYFLIHIFRWDRISIAFWLLMSFRLHCATMRFVDALRGNVTEVNIAFATLPAQCDPRSDQASKHRRISPSTEEEMNMRSLIFCISTAVIGLTAQSALGAQVFVMQIPGITGDVTVANYAGSISLSSFSAGFSNPAADGSGGVVAGKPTCQPIQVVKPLDGTSPKMAAAAFSGTPYPTVTLIALTQSPSAAYYYAFLTFTLNDVVVSSLNFAGAQTESLTLIYGQITVSYYAQSPTTGAIALVGRTNVNCITGTVN
jgi:type VI protein secretion system component Hcp